MVPVALELIAQKDIADCGIAALAMLLNRPYVEVSEAALALTTKPHKHGLWTSEIQRIAKRLGIVLARHKVLSEDATGLIILQRCTNGKNEGHVAVLFQGVIVNPADGLIWDYAAYLARGKWRLSAFLEIAE